MYDPSDHVSPLQTAFMIFAAMSGLGFLSLPRLISETSGVDAWFSIFLAGVICMIIGYFIIRLSLLFPSVTALEYTPMLVGKTINYVYAIGYLVFLLLFLGYSTRGFADVIKLFLLDQTPLEVITLGMIVVVVYGVQHGINTVARLSELFGPFILAAIILIILLSIQNADYRNVAPFLGHGMTQVVIGIPRGILFFLPGLSLLYILAPFQVRPRNLMLGGLSGLAIPTIIFPLATWFTTANLGHATLTTDIYPFLTLAKLIAFPGTFLERLEAIFITVWILSSFLTILINMYVAVFIISRLTGARGPRPFVLSIAPLIYLTGLSAPNYLVNLQLIDQIQVIGSFIIIFGLPVVYLGLGYRIWKMKRNQRKLAGRGLS